MMHLHWKSSHSWHLLSVWPAVEYFLYRKSLGVAFWLLKGKPKMDIQKQEGPVSLDVVVDGSGVKLVAKIQGSVGGGAAAGVLSAKSTNEIDLGAAQALDLADKMLKGHFPALSGVIDTAIGAGKAELAKLAAPAPSA